ncbi:hypothetical protein AGOR_G00083670 [Albula goreensis]|uniref:5'-deoxynucleotidase HDDC2 n=1 Tax=Albula goreensis TaxID=1534307 RepID=A0A8T3DNA6_9TELE|nr:hypothetical protein AGOR_G00083670 [Albula goreensis]
MAANSETDNMRNMLQFMKLIGQLKRVPRTGWVYRKVKQPESVSDHMYRMSMMALTITDRNINKEKCMKLALVHDMAECIVGDIAPADNISKAEKHRREEEAMKRLTGLLREGLREEIFDLWNEYEQQSSPEARLVKELDRLEMILQAHEYEELEQRPGGLQDFFDSTRGQFHHPEVVQLVKSLNEERAGHMAEEKKGTPEGSQSTDSQSNRPTGTS